jgi:hypothetical protein
MAWAFFYHFLQHGRAWRREIDGGLVYHHTEPIYITDHS